MIYDFNATAPLDEVSTENDLTEDLSGRFDKKSSLHLI